MPERKLKNILELTRDEKRDFINSFDTVLCDCDGVMWELTGPIRGSGDGANSLQEAGKDIYFVTNNSNNTDEVYIKKFMDIGFELDLNHIIHPVRTMISYLKKQHFNGVIYCITAKAVENALKKAGFRVLSGPREESKDILQFLDDILDDEPVRAVIIDFDVTISNAKLARAQLYLKNPDCLLIAGATDKTIPLRKDVSVIGPGYYIDILSEVSGKKPIVLGKPGHELGHIVRETCGIKDPKRALFIGDALEQDIGFGMKCGFQTLSVLSGISSKADVEEHHAEHGAPNYYANSISDFVKFFKEV
ncbi:unnamed protein product [Hermetia illucens]|nr:unnamed protein product [Hermetia illucens]